MSGPAFLSPNDDYGNFSLTAMGRSYVDLVLPTTKHERVLELLTLSYKPFFSCGNGWEPHSQEKFSKE